MIVTIYEGVTKDYVLIGSKDEQFIKKWGNVYTVPVRELYDELKRLFDWTQEWIGEELILEID